MSTANSLNWYISQFPESLYPCNKTNIFNYVNRVIGGRAIMARSSVFICGICRDVSQELFYTIPRIQTLADMFQEHYIYVYENDSKDTTPQILSMWKQNNPCIHIDSEKLGLNNYRGMEHDRTERMAFCRNKYLHHARSMRPFDYYIVLDFDIIGGWSYNGLANTFGLKDWDVVGSNGLIYQTKDDKSCRLYFDAWAYRAYGHKNKHEFLEANTLVYNRGEEPIRVYSCFGGLAVYKPKAFLSKFKYKDGDCDHPTFHLQLIDDGYNIFLNPSQITLYNKHEYCL